MKHLENQIVLVTGAASGIGRQVAIQAAQRGAYVIATDLNEAGLVETQAAIPAAQIETHRLDVSQAGDIAVFAERILPTLQNRRLVLVNNAGVALYSGSFLETSAEDFEWLISINMWGVIRMTRAFLPYMVTQNQGHVVNISSVFGLAGVAEQSAYCTAKFAVRGFTETLRMELFDTNVKTTVVHPGGIKTNIANAARIGANLDEETRKKDVATFNNMLTITTAEEAARQILEAVRTQKAKLVIGKDGRQIDFLTRFFPVGYTKLLLRELTKARNS
jgi:NAD(P)-dependent dehydrogenase (short-subunit alcohol dehydrogenase family)